MKEDLDLRRVSPPRRLRCAYCQNLLYMRKEWRGVPDNQRHSRDHILPRVYLRSGLHGSCGDIRIRSTCTSCNTIRAAIGHCPAAIAAARSTPGGIEHLKRWWNINRKEHEHAQRHAHD